LSWSAPVAAYGLVAAASATSDGEAHLYAFDARTGATLWDAYPLPDPVYPDRGGAALAGGHLLAATVEGVCVCVDALRGTRVWETALDGVVYGAVVPIADSADAPLLINVTKGDRSHSEGGELTLLHGKTGQILHRVRLPGPPDSAPAFAEGLAYTHDDGGHLTCVDVATGKVAWQQQCEAGFDSSPVIHDGQVFSATVAGVLWCHEAQTGELIWRTSVTNAPLGGTPAHDGTLVYLPADDGLHLVAAQTGRAVRRYPLRAPVRAAPIVANGALFFGASDGNIWGAGGGRPLEKLYETGGAGSQIIAAPAFADGAIFVTATNGVLYCLTHESRENRESGAAK
jgi:outer membrane protein assembly factor BamB